MPDPAAMRSAVESMMVRLLAGGETELAEQLVHPEFVNVEAAPERRNGPGGAAATHKPFAVKHVHLLRFADDGRVIEHSAVRDDLGMIMQLGLLPPLAAAGGNPPS